MEPVGVKNNGDGTHTVHYTPAQDGPYTVAVKYADQEVPHRYSINSEKNTQSKVACADMSSFKFFSAWLDLKEKNVVQHILYSHFSLLSHWV